MDREQIRSQLVEISHAPQLWASSRASYMLSVMDQQDAGAVLQAQVTDWMWDVIRRLNEDSDNETLRAMIESLAVSLGQLEV